MNIIIPGGFEPNFTVGFAKGLASNGVDLCVVSCDETAPRLTAAGIHNLNLRGSMDSNRSPWAKFVNLFCYYVRLLSLLFRHRGATVHFTGIFRKELILWEGLVLNSCFRLLAGRYLYTVHNVLPHNCKRSRFFGFVYRKIYQAPHLLLVHTRRSHQQLMEEFGVTADRLYLTSIGLNEEMPETSLALPEARSRLNLEKKDPAILFFGKIDEYKGVDLLLAAFDQITFPGLQLVIAGTFRNLAYREQIYSQMEQMSHRTRVHLHERFIPNEEVEVFFKACDVLCLPYRNIYQSGLVFLGPRFGIPMITTDVGSLREFVGDGLGVVSRTNDATGLAEALREFLATPELFSRDVIMERSEKYLWTHVCRELVPLYSGRTCQPQDRNASAQFNNSHSTAPKGAGAKLQRQHP